MQSIKAKREENYLGFLFKDLSIEATDESVREVYDYEVGYYGVYFELLANFSFSGLSATHDSPGESHATLLHAEVIDLNIQQGGIDLDLSPNQLTEINQVINQNLIY